MTDPKIFLLLPTHNRPDLLHTLFLCIKKQTFLNHQTIVVNTGQPLPKRVEHELPRLQILPTFSNNWWTGSMRLGVDYIVKQARPEDFVLTLNDDVKFNPNYLFSLLITLKQHPQSLIGSVCLAAEKNHPPIETGRRIDWQQDGGFTHKLTLPANYSKLPPIAVDALSGKGTLIPISAFKKIGNYHPLLPHYGADYEFSIRAKRSGFPLILSYQSVVINQSPEGSLRLKNNQLSLKHWIQHVFSKRSKLNPYYRLIYSFLVVPKKYWPGSIKHIFYPLLQQLTHIKSLT